MKIKKLSLKMQIALNLLFLIVMIPLAISVFSTTSSEISHRTANELINNTRLINDMTHLYVNSAVENYLRAIAEKTRALIQTSYDKYTAGTLTRQEAFSEARALILDKNYGKIGTTGYIAGVSSRGILTIHPASEGADASGHDFMKKAMEMKNGFLTYEWQNPGEESPRDKVGYMAYFEPWDIIVWASSYKSEFRFLIDETRLKEKLKELKNGETGYNFILNSTGKLIFHPELESLDIKNIDNPSIKAILDMMSEAKIRSGDIIQRTYIGETDGLERMASMIYYEEMDWYIVSSISKGEIYGILYTLGRILIFISLGAFVVMNFVIFWLLKMMLTPLKRISKAVNQVSEGDISHQIDICSADEIGAMTGDINHLIEGLNKVFCRMKHDVEILNTSIQDLSSSSKEIATTSNEQASAVKEIVTTMEDSDQLSKGIESMINEVSNIANATKEKVRDGVNNIEESLVKMSEIRTSNDDTISGIRSLSEKIEAIWEIVTIINSIADQTKIIAFNAELEASAAGEAGKNFQIVASEIRRLADSTVNSTSEIKSKINEIQRSSDRLITASEDGTNKIKEGDALTQSLHQTFEEIMESSEITAGSAGNISDSIKQMVVAFEQILLTLKQISEGINNFVISTNSNTGISQKLKDMANSMGTFLSYYNTTDVCSMNQSLERSPENERK
ncbi:MAG: methyl-accepting chemotaxis protein [Spirochaetales bacterium]|nr:methyl-accepting chemotaxis protein [Spirochaetales bacterium]